MVPLTWDNTPQKMPCTQFLSEGDDSVARINIEDSIYQDIRFDALMAALGGDREKAIGALVRAWTLAQAYFLTPVNARLIPLTEWDRQKINPAIIEAGFAEVRDGGIYVCGSEQQFAWLLQKSNAGRKSAESRAKQKSTPVDARSTPVNARQPLPLTLPLTQDNTVTRVLVTPPTDKSQSAAPPAKNTYAFNEPSDFTGLLGGYITGWVELYDAEFIKREVSKAILWLKANPRKNKKTLRGWVAFFGGWFDRGWGQHSKGLPANKAPEQFDPNKRRFYD